MSMLLSDGFLTVLRLWLVAPRPIGMFGTRLNGRDVHASARYIHTKLTTLLGRQV